jgi:hypothetical protein
MIARIAWGIVAGLFAGLVLGGLLHVMVGFVPAGGQASMMSLVAFALGTDRLSIAWLVHLAVSAGLGALFSLLLGRRGQAWDAAAAWGLACGIAWWIVAALVLLPLGLGLPVLAPLRQLALFPFAVSTLMGSIFFGAIMGSGVAWLSGRPARATSTRELRRAA